MPQYAAPIQDLTRDLLAKYPPATELGGYLIYASSPYSDIARTVECQVFEQFFGNTPETMTAEYGPYEGASWFFLVVDRDQQRPAGATRATFGPTLKTLVDISGPPFSLPTDEVLADHGIDMARCWDVGTLAVVKEYRGGSSGRVVSSMLYGYLHLEGLQAGIEHLVAILDRHTFQQLVSFGIPFTPILDSAAVPYLGSDASYAAYLHLPSLASGVMSQLGSMPPMLAPMLRRIALGEALPPVTVVR